MSHGAPDYHNVRKEVSVFRLDDMGELAARLASPVVWDRRGDVFCIEDFECGLERWDKTDSGGDESYILSPDKPNHGAYCAYLKTKSGVGGYVLFYKGFPLTASQRIGFEAHVKPVQAFGYFDLYFNWYTGTQRKQYYIRFDFVNKQIKYKDSDGTLQVLIDDLDPDPTISYYHFLKFVVDVEDDEYLWVRYNEQTETFTETSGYITTDADAPHLTANVLFYDNANNQGICRLDTIILTQDEP